MFGSKPLREAIKREHHEQLQQMMFKLADKKIFTVIDERHAFWKVE